MLVPFFLQNSSAQYAIVENGHAAGFMSSLSVWLYQQNWEMGSRKKIIFRPFLPLINQNISLIIPKHRPLSRISQLFAEKLEGSVRNIINLTKLEFQLDSLEESS